MTMMKMVIRVAVDQINNVVVALAGVEHSGFAVYPDTNGSTETTIDAAHDAKIDRQVREANRARRATTATARVERTTTRQAATANKRAAGARIGRIVLYSPASAATVRKALDTMAPASASTIVLADLQKHPKSKNADVRARVAKAFGRNGLSVESVDNTIWQLVNKGLVTKAAQQ